ncbi:hypothetical protein GAY29_24340 [Azospirillum brasilense]|uniref:hypothetical protein n=1 Tax=Azospirillum brasilense TaxID=192 RepID=UPI00190B2A8C|nr:hypothetical protein [Azospirillum brasilense]MBK3736175.1 hypothetical protein [Azospirillum brasilense]
MMMTTPVRSGAALAACIEDDAIIRVLPAEQSAATMKFVDWLQETLQRWACGQRAAADRRKLDMIVQAAEAMDYRLSLTVQDIFDIIDDLDAALDAGLLLLRGFDRPVIRVHLVSKGATQ